MNPDEKSWNLYVACMLWHRHVDWFPTRKLMWFPTYVLVNISIKLTDLLLYTLRKPIVCSECGKEENLQQYVLLHLDIYTDIDTRSCVINPSLFYLYFSFSFFIGQWQRIKHPLKGSTFCRQISLWRVSVYSRIYTMLPTFSRCGASLEFQSTAPFVTCCVFL